MHVNHLILHLIELNPTAVIEYSIMFYVMPLIGVIPTFSTHCGNQIHTFATAAPSTFSGMVFRTLPILSPRLNMFLGFVQEISFFAYPQREASQCVKFGL
jgi:hypothetical protein